MFLQHLVPDNSFYHELHFTVASVVYVALERKAADEIRITIYLLILRSTGNKWAGGTGNN
jgi:hypothetical protein